MPLEANQARSGQVGVYGDDKFCLEAGPGVGKVSLWSLLRSSSYLSVENWRTGVKGAGRYGIIGLRTIVCTVLLSEFHSSGNCISWLR